MLKFFNFCTIVLFLIVANMGYLAAQEKSKTLIVFFDGLRPDYITPEHMPNLYALKKKGSYGQQHHSVFPTVTRVNSASYASGSYPATHGLMGNAVYFPEIEKSKGLNTGEARELNRITAVTSGNLLTTVSLGELLQAAGERLMVFSSGSTGQALLQNHKISGGAIINPDMILPAAFEPEVIAALGIPPASAKPNTARHSWVTDAFLKYGLVQDGPMVSALWFSDPDGTAHQEGIGSPLAMQAIKNVDQELGRILQAIEEKGLTESYNILISTDHGFVTDIGNESLSELLIKKGLKKDEKSEDVVVAGGAIYVQNHTPKKIKAIVEALQAEEWIGAIFTASRKAGDLTGSIEGTLSFESIDWNHAERSADILASVNWNDQENEYGYKGTSFARGVAGHGGSSPYEIDIPFIVAGPAFKKAHESALPTSNVDIVPTVLHLHGLQIPDKMNGRVVNELLEKPADIATGKAKTEKIETSVQFPWGTYHLVLERTILGNYSYMNYTKTTRTRAAAKRK